MKFKQAIYMAFKSIFNNKVRSFLTMLGIIIGVCAVMTLVSLVQGNQKQMMEYYERQGTNKIDVSAYSWGKDFSKDLYDFCLGMDDLVVGVTPNQSGWGLNVKYRTKLSQDTRVLFGNDQFSICNNYKMSSGRDIAYMDVQKYNMVCVIGGAVKNNLFNLKNPIGETISISGYNFKVVGVFEDREGGQQYSGDDMVLVPYVLNRLLMSNSSVTEFVVKAVDKPSTEKAMAKLNAFLETKVGQRGWYQVWSSNYGMEMANEQTRIMSLVLGGIAGIALLVGGIGIMNIMLVTVTERTREIGIRKAIGAERGAIITQFLIEASVISGFGGIIGIMIGFLLTLVLGKVIFNLTLFPTTFISIGAMLFSVVIGVGFGLYPAIKASGLQPVDALRSE